MANGTPRRAGLLDPAVQSKVAEFFLQRGGKWTAYCLCSAALFYTIIAALDIDQPRLQYLKGIAVGLFYFSLAMGYGSLFWTAKRGNDMVATGLGEIKSESPNLKNSSADPAIDRVIVKIDQGIDPQGTSTPPKP